MIIKSFGDSFIFGNDLADDGRDGPYATASNLTWPALIANKLNADYRCYAKGGSGNLQILKRVLHHAAAGQGPDVLYIIGWTWIDRFDYIRPDHKEMWETFTPTTQGPVADFYYRNLHSELLDKITSLIYIRSAIDALEQKKIPFLMTFMDSLLLDRRWNANDMILDCQERVRPYLHTFDGITFLEWSKEKGFPISPTLHPLEPAHEAAAELMLPTVQQILDQHLV